MDGQLWAIPSGAGGNTQHLMIIGSTRKGKSLLLQAEANRLGISYEELERRLEPTAEQEEQMRMREEAEERKEEERLQAVRQAVWDAWSDDDSAFTRLHDAMVSTVMEESPSRAQMKAVFMLLPATVIGLGIAWGFTDTEVGDDIHRFIEENEDAVRATLAAAQG